MKSIFNILILTFSYTALAGNGGGTMAATNGKTIQGGSVGTIKSLDGLTRGGTGGGGVLSPKLPTEIIYNFGKKDGVVKFAYGQQVGQEWQIQDVEMLEAELLKDVAVIKALQDSSALKSWVEIK